MNGLPLKLKRDIPSTQEFVNLKEATSYFQGMQNILNTVSLE